MEGAREFEARQLSWTFAIPTGTPPLRRSRWLNHQPRYSGHRLRPAYDGVTPYGPQVGPDPARAVDARRAGSRCTGSADGRSLANLKRVEPAVRGEGWVVAPTRRPRSRKW